MCFGERSEYLVAGAIDDRQLRGDLPAILREEARLPAAVVGRGNVEVAGLVVVGAEQSRSDLVVLLRLLIRVGVRG